MLRCSETLQYKLTKQHTATPTQHAPTVYSSIRLYQEVSLHSHGPVEVSEYLKGNLDSWEFDVFHFEQLAGGTPLRYLGFELFKKHSLIKKFEVHCLYSMPLLYVPVNHV